MDNLKLNFKMWLWVVLLILDVFDDILLIMPLTASYRTQELCNITNKWKTCLQVHYKYMDEDSSKSKDAGYILSLED